MTENEESHQEDHRELDYQTPAEYTIIPRKYNMSLEKIRETESDIRRNLE